MYRKVKATEADIEQIWRSGTGKWWGILNRVISEVFVEKVKFEERLEGGEMASHGDVCGVMWEWGIQVESKPGQIPWSRLLLACSDPRNTRGDWMMSGVNDGGIIGIVSKVN